MLYKGYFTDIDEVHYCVELTTNNDTSTVEEIVLSDTPCVINMVSDGLFSPIKSRSCNIVYVARFLKEDLFTADPMGVKVKVKNIDSNKILFRGFLTPCSYNQQYYNYSDYIELFAVDSISVLKEKKYVNKGNTANILPVSEIVSNCLRRVGLDGDFYYPSVCYAGGGYDILDRLYLQESNFFDSDEERTPWSCYDVLSEICKFFGWSLVLDGDDVHFVDYHSVISSGKRKEYWYKYQMGASSVVAETTQDTEIDGDDYIGADTNIGYDEIYSKINVVQSAYDLDDIISDISDDKNLISVTNEKGLGSSGRQYNYFGPRFLFFGGKKTDEYRQYCSFFRPRPESGWSNRYYNISTGASVDDYDDGSSSMNWVINDTINTRCALIQKYCSYESGKKRPTSLGWDTCLTFFLLNDTAGNVNSGSWYSAHCNEAALVFQNSDIIRYSPAHSGDKLWFTINGDIWYQQYYKKIGSQNNIVIYNSDEGYYAVSPFDNILPANAKPYKEAGRSFTLGWPCLRCKLRIGNKYWDGSSWTTTDSYFSIRYSSPVDDDTNDAERFMFLEWMAPVANTDFTDKVNKDCFAVPMSYDDDLVGDLEFSICWPDIRPHLSSETRSWDKWPVCVYLKDFELGLTFTSGDDWYMDILDSDKDDIIFTHYVESSYVREMDDVVCKINTNVKIPAQEIHSRPSKSSVLTSDGFLGEMNDGNRLGVQEENLVEKYFDHYSKKNMIFEASIKNAPEVINRYTVDTTGISTKKFVLDSYNWDVYNKKNKIKLIEY